MDGNAVLGWFTGLGLVWREAPLGGGALYPFSNKATSVLEVLQAELDRRCVEQYCGVAVRRIAQDGQGFQLEIEGQDESCEHASLRADAVVFAAGGGSEPLAACEKRRSDGGAGVLEEIEQVPFSPVLGPIKTTTDLLDGLDGIRTKARLSIAGKRFSEEGEVLFRAYGLSGIVVFNASRFVDPGDTILLDLVPERSLERLEELLFERLRFQAQRNGRIPSAGELLQGFFLPELARALVCASRKGHVSGHSDDGSVSDTDINALARAIKAFPLEVKGIGDAKQCQVHRGGFSENAFDADTMEAFALPCLYLTGEAIDVDGPCGGYNLHWAWASGLLAGLSVAQRLRSTPEFSSTDSPIGA